MISQKGARGRGPIIAALLAALLAWPAATPARALRAGAPPIAKIVVAPDNPAVRYGVDAIEQVVRSTDGGASWEPVFNPGDAQAPDPATPGSCLPGNFERVAFLAINPARPHGLYVGTEGVLGDYLDNGCGNAPGGLFYSENGATGFVPLNHGLPANADARGGGVAWGVQAITFDPNQPTTFYVATDPSFLAVPGGNMPPNPTAPGIYRTLDGGAQWDPAFAGIGTTPCQFGPCRYPGSLVVVPGQSLVLLYATDTGFYRSTDRGDHWLLQAALASSDRAHFLVRVDPYHPTLVYVVTDKAIYRSNDGGTHLPMLPVPPVPPAEVADITFRQAKVPELVYTLRDGRQVTVEDRGPAPLPAATPAPRRTAAPSASPTSTTMATPPGPARATATPTVERPPSATLTSTVAPANSATPPAPTATFVAGSATWPMIGHDAGQSYADPAGGMAPAAVKKLRLRWQMAGEYPAIAANGILYAIDGGGKVAALNHATGAVVHRYQSTGVRSLAYDARTLYFNRGTEIRIVDAATADWRHSASDARGRQAPAFDQIVIAHRRIFTGIGAPGAASLGRYYSFDAATGKLLWDREGSLSSIPCIAGGVLYLSLGAGGAGDTYLLDPVSGGVRGVVNGFGTAQWHSSGDRVYASVLKGSGGTFRAFINAYGLDGQARWVAHDILFGAALPGTMFGVTPGAVDARSAVDGHRLWRTAVPGLSSVALGGVAAVGNLVLAQAPDGRIAVMDAATGALLRVLRPPVAGSNAGNLLVAGGLVFESVSRKLPGGTFSAPILLAFGA